MRGSSPPWRSSPFYIAENAYQNAAPYLTSYAVFPKFETLVASKKAWAALSPSEQAAIRQAVADTRGHSGRLADREALELTQLCHQGVVLDRPSAAQLGALARSCGHGSPGERGRGRRGPSDPGVAGNRRAAERDRDSGLDAGSRATRRPRRRFTGS